MSPYDRSASQAIILGSRLQTLGRVKDQLCSSVPSLHPGYSSGLSPVLWPDSAGSNEGSGRGRGGAPIFTCLLVSGYPGSWGISVLLHTTSRTFPCGLCFPSTTRGQRLDAQVFCMPPLGGASPAVNWIQVREKDLVSERQPLQGEDHR